jgi:hypothetical protein
VSFLASSLGKSSCPNRQARCRWWSVACISPFAFAAGNARAGPWGHNGFELKCAADSAESAIFVKIRPPLVNIRAVEIVVSLWYKTF